MVHLLPPLPQQQHSSAGKSPFFVYKAAILSFPSEFSSSLNHEGNEALSKVLVLLIASHDSINVELLKPTNSAMQVKLAEIPMH